MYNAHFGFREKPFSVTPDPRFFFASPVYREAYASLVLGIQERKGFIVMTGEVGTGKTLLLRMLMNNLEATVRFVFFYNTTLSFEELLSFTCEELGLPVEGRGRLEQMQTLNRFLVDQLSKGGTAALLIDEAQHLSEDVLENLRLLSNLETGSEKLLQIVLVGQPELQQKLARPELRQLKQRVSVQCRLAHLTAPEVAGYVEHRLRTVGYQGSDLFGPSALKCITQSTNGIPRLINNICDNALTIAYATARRKISADIIHEVVRDLQLDLPAKAIATDEDRTAPRSVAATSVQQPHQPNGQRAWVRADDLPAPLTASTSSALVATDWLEDREPDRLWVWILAILCLFAIVGAGLYAIHAGMPPEVGRPARPDAADPPETQPTDAEHSAPNGGQNRREQSSPSLVRPEATTVPAHALVVERGATAIAIARKTYGASFVLGLSLMKQFNPHVDNLNWVMVGEELRLPPVTRETLLHGAPDGSQSLLLTALFTMPAADRLARVVRAAGYEVVITRQWISDDVALHRVEIAALESAAQVDQAWDRALANHWIAYAEDGTGRKDQWATRTTP